MDDDDYDPNEWIYETLSRTAIVVNETTDQTWLDSEVRDRLEALLAVYNVDPTPDGWRNFAIDLALKHEPVLQIVTPVDRPEGKGGRPVTLHKFIQKSQVKIRMRKGMTQAEAIRSVAKDHGMKPKTLSNVMAEPTPLPVEMTRKKYEWRMEGAAVRAAKDLSR